MTMRRSGSEVLTRNDPELHSLARAAGVEASPEMLDILIDLVQHVSPQGVVAFLRGSKYAKDAQRRVSGQLQPELG